MLSTNTHWNQQHPKKNRALHIIAYTSKFDALQQNTPVESKLFTLILYSTAAVLSSIFERLSNTPLLFTSLSLELVLMRHGITWQRVCRYTRWLIGIYKTHTHTTVETTFQWTTTQLEGREKVFSGESFFRFNSNFLNRFNPRYCRFAGCPIVNNMCPRLSITHNSLSLWWARNSKRLYMCILVPTISLFTIICNITTDEIYYVLVITCFSWQSKWRKRAHKPV
jgi:hypothetical protein